MYYTHTLTKDKHTEIKKRKKSELVECATTQSSSGQQRSNKKKSGNYCRQHTAYTTHTQDIQERGIVLSTGYRTYNHTMLSWSKSQQECDPKIH